MGKKYCQFDFRNLVTFVILQVTDTIMFKTNLLFLYCWCVSVLNSDIFCAFV